MSAERNLRIDLKPSRGLAAAIVALHAAAGTCAGALMAGPAGVCLGALIAGLGVAAARDRALLLSKRSPRALQVEGKDSLTLELANDERVPLRAGARRYVSRFLVILPVSASMRRTIIVAGNMLEPDSFRALRLWALWGQLPPSAPHGASLDPETVQG